MGTLTSNPSAVFGPKLLRDYTVHFFFVKPFFLVSIFFNERFSKYKSWFAVVIALSGSAGFNALLVPFTRSLYHSFLSFVYDSLLNFWIP